MGLTQEELAEKAGISVRAIREIETGRIARPRSTTVRLLAGALALEPGDRERFYVSAFVPSARPPSVKPAVVTTAGDVSPAVLGALCALVERSLLAAETASAGDTSVRYRLLAALHDYAERQLAELASAGEVPVNRRPTAW